VIADPAQFGDEDEEPVEVNLQPRTADEVARRVIALTLVVDRAFDADSPPNSDWAMALDIHSLLTEQERSFFFDPAPAQQAIVNFTWRSEALVPLMWALGRIDEMPPLNQEVGWGDLGTMNSVFEDPQAFIATARLRPHEEIETLEGHLYHQHWRVRDAHHRQVPVPEDLDASIVYERRYAASWLVGDGDDWDDVPTDT
jgi:hypothetical protein